MKPNRSTATAEAMYSLESDCTNWSVIGETIQWHGSADTKPTDAEIKAEVDRLDADYAVQETIKQLEATVTQRRIREITTVAGAKWIDDLEKLIAIERAKL